MAKMKTATQPQTNGELEIIRQSIAKNIPFGNDSWVGKMVGLFKLGQTLRKVGRPKKNGG
jgi:hypothetical protein